MNDDRSSSTSASFLLTDEDLATVNGGMKWEGQRESTNVIDCRGDNVDSKAALHKFEVNCLGSDY